MRGNRSLNLHTRRIEKLARDARPRFQEAAASTTGGYAVTVRQEQVVEGGVRRSPDEAGPDQADTIDTVRALHRS